MKANIHRYPILIKETNLDLYGHVNNATYFTFLEDARWDLITQNGYGYAKILETGLGPVVLEASIRYIKELRLRDEIVIETSATTSEGKTSKMLQKIMRGDELCCTAEFTFGLFDLKERKLVKPTPEWITAITISCS